MSLVLALIGLAAALSLTMAGAWAVAMRTGRSGWIDAIWSFAVGLFGTAAALLPLGAEAFWPRQGLVAGLVLLWSLRLGCHIAARTMGDGADDPRYRELKKEWGPHFRARLFLFLQIQAAAAFVLVLSVMAAAHNPVPGWRIGDGLGVALLVVSVLGEGIADRQLTAFRASASGKGQVCERGLWGWSRHPNYFFEWLGWLAYAAIAIAPHAGYPPGWLALAGPVMMYWLLVHVSGIPPLEAHMLRSRGGAFRDYQRRVNAFWPAPPRAAAIANDPGRRVS